MITQDGAPVLQIELTNPATGAYTVTQLAPIDHPAGLDENDFQITVEYAVTDGDGDSGSASSRSTSTTTRRRSTSRSDPARC